MPIRYEIDPSADRVTVTYTGLITPEENLASYLAYLEDPAARPSQDYLVDLTDVTDFESNFAGIRNMVSRLVPLYANRTAGALTAICAPGEVAFGVARMYQSLNSIEGLENISIFKSKREALKFLDSKTRHFDGRIDALDPGDDP